MFRFLLGFVGALSLVMLGGCSALPVGSKLVQAEWNSPLVEGVSNTFDKPILQEHKGAVFQIRYSAAGRLMARNLLTGVDTLVWDGTDDGLRSDGIASFSNGDRLFIAWRPKLNRNHPTLGGEGDKMVYVASSADGLQFDQPARISSSNGAFPPAMAGSKTNDLYVVWQDERSGSGFDLFFNVSHDQGKTWKPQDIRMDVGELGESFSGEPTLLVDRDRVWLAWSESTKDGYVHFVRTSTNRGETWGEPVPVFKSRVAGFFPQLVLSKQSLLLYWFDQDTVRVAVSPDLGATWSIKAPIVEMGDGGSKMQELLVRTDHADVVHLLYGKKGGESTSRSNLYYLRSEDGVTFSEARRLNSEKEFAASAVLPSLATDGSNGVMVAWMDYRFFRPIVIGAYSPDNGKSWGHDTLLDKGPESGVSQFPGVLRGAGKWWLSLIRYDKKTMAQGVAVANQLDPTQLSTVVAKFGEVDQEQLKHRLDVWWKSRLAGQWETSYDLSDPFMRAMTSKKKYLSTQGEIKYYDYEVVSIEFEQERKAKVKIKFTYEMPELEIKGRKYTVSKREAEADQEWIWVDGDWYLLFKDIFGKSFLDL